MGGFTQILSPKKPKAPQVIMQKAYAPAPIAAPTVDNSAKNIADAQAAEEERLKKQRGRAATILTGTGDDGTLGTATKKLLGGSL